MGDKDFGVRAMKEALEERFGVSPFGSVTVEVTPLPDHFKKLCKVPEAADYMYYFRVTTSLGTFGTIFGLKGMVIDLTELGLTCRDLVGHVDGMPETDDFSFGFNPIGTDYLDQFERFLGSRQTDS